MTGPCGRSRVEPAEPIDAICQGIISWLALSEGSDIAVVDAAKLASSVLEHVELGGYPLSCIHKGHVDLAYEGSEDELIRAFGTIDVMDGSIRQLMNLRAYLIAFGLTEPVTILDHALAPMFGVRPALRAEYQEAAEIAERVAAELHQLKDDRDGQNG